MRGVREARRTVADRHRRQIHGAAGIDDRRRNARVVVVGVGAADQEPGRVAVVIAVEHAAPQIHRATGERRAGLDQVRHPRLVPHDVVAPPAEHHRTGQGGRHPSAAHRRQQTGEGEREGTDRGVEQNVDAEARLRREVGVQQVEAHQRHHDQHQRGDPEHPARGVPPQSRDPRPCEPGQRSRGRARGQHHRPPGDQPVEPHRERERVCGPRRDRTPQQRAQQRAHHRPPQVRTQNALDAAHHHAGGEAGRDRGQQQESEQGRGVSQHLQARFHERQDRPRALDRLECADQDAGLHSEPEAGRDPFAEPAHARLRRAITT